MPDQFERLFVYGTLLPGHGNHARIEAHVRLARPGTIQGMLVDLGAFPALIHGDGIVKGMLLDVNDEAIRTTDFIEGCHADRSRSLYVREEVQVDLDDGNIVDAWTYFFAQPASIGGRPKLVIGRIEDTPVFAWQGRDQSTCK